MEYTVFYSWQTDAPNSTNRGFIRDAIKAALESTDGQLVESPRLDSGMEGIAGTPEVASIMFEKIERSAVFVADVTLVGTIPSIDDGRPPKRTPNPNVSLELGYAASHLGWGRVICVMNEHFGARHDQPFDVRNRRFPIDYSLNPEEMDSVADVRQNLASWIRKALDAVLENDHMEVDRAIERFDVGMLIVSRAYGERDSFPDLGEEARAWETEAGRRDVETFRNAVRRMLDARILRTHVAGRRYAYHWTYFGREVLRGLRDRQLL